jgi:hypothetical protein
LRAGAADSLAADAVGGLSATSGCPVTVASGSVGMADGVDFGCHFLRSGVGCGTAGVGGLAGVVAAGCSSVCAGGAETEGVVLGCHFFLSGEGAFV